MLRDVQTFVAALDTTFGGFRERADATYGLLAERGTAFVVVAAPERDALREASYFVERLAAERMPLAGLVLNRVQEVRGRRAERRGRASTAAERADDGDHLTSGCCGCTRTACGAADRQRAVAPGSRRAPRHAGGGVRARPRTCTTWTACGRSAHLSRRSPRPGASGGSRRRDCARRSPDSPGAVVGSWGSAPATHRLAPQD